MTPDHPRPTGPGSASGDGWIVVQGQSAPRLPYPSIEPLLVRGSVGAIGVGGEVTVAAGGRISFDTLLNAFPAAWWRSTTGCETVTCSLTLSAAAEVAFLHSTASGVVARIAVERVEGGGAVTRELLLPADDGGWLWAEVSAGEVPVVVSHVAWSLRGPARRSATTAICITTYDREADCIGVLRTLAEATDLESVQRVIVVDQGSRALQVAEGFDLVDSMLGDRLRVIRQHNLGGSGGFSRGMLESLAEGVEFALVLDDDVRVDPESVRRLIMAGALASEPTLVGAQMMSLTDPTVLHSFGELLDRRTWTWRPAVPDLAGADLATVDFSEPSLHRRVEVDFNGWWMCLIPTSVIRRQGASMPFFIKWDDTEFALRARRDGVSTVTLPGAVVWHMPWTTKDDGLDWQAYFQLRNRLVTALLHAESGGGVLRASLAQDINHILCQQYGSAAVRRLALQDVLRGPEHLAASLRRRGGDARSVLARAGQMVVPRPDHGFERTIPSRPHGSVSSAMRLTRVLAHQLRRTPASGAVEASLARPDGKWWSVGLLDGVAVESSTGAGVFVSRRNRRMSLALARDAVLIRLRLGWRWRRLARAYRAERDQLAGSSAWQESFDRASG